MTGIEAFKFFEVTFQRIGRDLLLQFADGLKMISRIARRRVITGIVLTLHHLLSLRIGIDDAVW
jgi:hypothetical protein